MKYKIIGQYFKVRGLDPRDCKHTEVDVFDTGGIHTYQGEYWDNLVEHCVCRLCGAELTAIDQPVCELEII